MYRLELINWFFSLFPTFGGSGQRELQDGHRVAEFCDPGPLPAEFSSYLTTIIGHSKMGKNAGARKKSADLVASPMA